MAVKIVLNAIFFVSPDMLWGMLDSVLPVWLLMIDWFSCTLQMEQQFNFETLNLELSMFWILKFQSLNLQLQLDNCNLRAKYWYCKAQSQLQVKLSLKAQLALISIDPAPTHRWKTTVIFYGKWKMEDTLNILAKWRQPQQHLLSLVGVLSLVLSQISSG